MNDNKHIQILFGRRVRKLRKELNLSQEEFADICDLDRTYISSLERGHRNVGLRNIEVIAKALDISLSQLFEGLQDDE